MLCHIYSEYISIKVQNVLPTAISINSPAETHFEVASSMKARKVLNPPLRTAGPILVRVATARASRVGPRSDMKQWAT